ncbi:MAG: hypothetical protein K8W52_33800 [Deltaproteobacteria bacterium]|nr:hypothetical protein [Deltaproteobacteria bacterium]
MKTGKAVKRKSKQPVADVWRPVIREIVEAFTKGDYALAKGITSVKAPSKARASHAKKYVADYGETLTELPDETWATSESHWTGTHWDVLVDLWTRESGRSDLVLFLRVHEVGAGYAFEVDSLHVP